MYQRYLTCETRRSKLRPNLTPGTRQHDSLWWAVGCCHAGVGTYTVTTILFLLPVLFLLFAVTAVPAGSGGGLAAVHYSAADAAGVDTLNHTFACFLSA